MPFYSVKRLFAGLVLTCLSALSSAQAQTVSNVGFAFPTDTPKIFFQFASESSGQFTATLYVVNIGDIVPAGYEMASITLTGEPEEILNYTFASPDDGWPVGIYRIMVSRGAEPIHQSDFHVFDPYASSNPATTPQQ